MLHMTELLMHDDDIPVAARIALASARSGRPEDRCDNLVTAAQILHHEVGIDCADALELVGAGSCECPSQLAAL